LTAKGCKREDFDSVHYKSRGILNIIYVYSSLRDHISQTQSRFQVFGIIVKLEHSQKRNTQITLSDLPRLIDHNRIIHRHFYQERYKHYISSCTMSDQHISHYV